MATDVSLYYDYYYQTLYLTFRDQSDIHVKYAFENGEEVWLVGVEDEDDGEPIVNTAGSLSLPVYPFI